MAITILRELQYRLLAVGTGAVLNPPAVRRRRRLLQFGVGAAIGFAAVAIFNRYCVFTWDAGGRVGGSLPFSAYLTVRGLEYGRGDMVAFRWKGGYRYAAGTRMVKIVWGLPGDPITRVGRKFYVAGQYAGEAQERNTAGMALPINAADTVPPGHLYVYAPNPDSLDSRYGVVGFVPFSAIEGRTFAFQY